MHLRTVNTVMVLQSLSPLSPISYIRKCRKLGWIRVIYVGNACIDKPYATQVSTFMFEHVALTCEKSRIVMAPSIPPMNTF
jgi:hypothetical protein